MKSRRTNSRHLLITSLILIIASSLLVKSFEGFVDNKIIGFKLIINFNTKTFEKPVEENELFVNGLITKILTASNGNVLWDNAKLIAPGETVAKMSPFPSNQGKQEVIVFVNPNVLQPTSDTKTYIAPWVLRGPIPDTVDVALNKETFQSAIPVFQTPTGELVDEYGNSAIGGIVVMGHNISMTTLYTIIGCSVLILLIILFFTFRKSSGPTNSIKNGSNGSGSVASS